ncbi:IMP cyclohydrolase [Candidatus Woesearchaeota archaeon CG11_big_fil_rev_8_21_14_0_20_43_8]|nr:MAG: IMP cyclohydrolase [Candidatus Woesearchaeota archaeon CG11_big_fil_rev_8_21_14_0_20_43_8]PIO05703.1 MAG: IMP cyclohydrolase [Candidatus Woesearchaeota archaeon CG08_land_8_20_14_0_20_43_7]
MPDIKKIYSNRNIDDFNDMLFINGVEYEKVSDLRYGDNPNQPAAFYRPKGGGCFFGEMEELKTGKNGMSFTNIADIHHAINILKFFDDPACAVMKHLNPSGVSIDDDLKTAYINARDSDARSAFGSVVVFNRDVDIKTAEEINTTFVEVVVAPDFSLDVLSEFEKKKNLRVVKLDFVGKIPRFAGDDTSGYVEMKKIGNGCIALQMPYLCSMKTKDDLILPEAKDKDGNTIRIGRIPTSQEYVDLLFAWYVNIGVRSNGIVFVKDKKTIAVGTGEQERVGAIERAIAKANAKHPAMLKGSIVASDGFFPFRDSIDTLAKEGVTAVIQPGGSLRDAEVIEACNEHGIAMVFTGERCFGHF